MSTLVKVCLVLNEVLIYINFCQKNLLLNLHPRKVEIRKLHLGIDFLGYVSLLNHVVLRTRTKKRMLNKLIRLRSGLESGKIEKEKVKQTLSSYLGMLKHCRGEKIKDKIRKILE